MSNDRISVSTGAIHPFRGPNRTHKSQPALHKKGTNPLRDVPANFRVARGRGLSPFLCRAVASSPSHHALLRLSSITVLCIAALTFPSGSGRFVTAAPPPGAIPRIDTPTIDRMDPVRIRRRSDDAPDRPPLSVSAETLRQFDASADSIGKKDFPEAIRQLQRILDNTEDSSIEVASARTKSS